MAKLPKFIKQLTNVDTAITTLLITNLVSVAAFWLLFKTYCQPNQIDWSKSSEVVKNIVEVVAIFVAGVWTYYLFIRGRLHKERVELVLKGRLVTIDCCSRKQRARRRLFRSWLPVHKPQRQKRAAIK